MTTYLPRSAWTSTAPGFARYSARRLKSTWIDWLALHYPGAGNFTAAKDSKAKTAARLRGYRNYHVGTRGWADIGYCDAVDQQGRIWACAGVKYAAAHSASKRYPRANYEGFGLLCILGNNETPSRKMRIAIRSYRKMRRRQFRNLRAVYGHQQILGASTACPGKAMMALIRAGDFLINAPLPKRAKPAVNPYEVVADKVWGEFMSYAFQWDLTAIGFDDSAIDGNFGRYGNLAVQKWLRARKYYDGPLDALTFGTGYLSEHTNLVGALQQYCHDRGSKYRNSKVDGILGEWAIYDLQLILQDGKVK